MRGAWLIVRRELGTMSKSLWGYLIVAAILLIDGLFFNAFALTDQPRFSTEVLEDFFYFAFGTTCVASVFLTMRLIAEERQTGTLVLIDASPLPDWQVIVGKFLSGFAVLAILTLLTLYMPALIFINGKVSAGHIAVGYLGLLLVSAATAAIGTFASTVSRSQLVAGVLCGAIIVALLVFWMLARVAQPPLDRIFAYASLYDRHFEPFRQGKLALEDVVYLLSLTFVFLTLATRWFSARRWP